MGNNNNQNTQGSGARSRETTHWLHALERIKERHGISQRELAEAIGTTPTTLSSIVSGRSNISMDIASKTINHYQLNPAYLFFGEGAVFLDAPEKPQLPRLIGQNARVIPVLVDMQDRERIAFVPHRAQAGFFHEYPEGDYATQYPSFNLPNYSNGAAVAFEVEGDSMARTLQPGDIVVAEPVEKLDWINPKEIHVVAADRGILIKRFIYNRSEGALQWVCDNESYNDIPASERSIPVEEVRHVFKYYCHITRHTPMPDKTNRLLMQSLHTITRYLKPVG